MKSRKRNLKKISLNFLKNINLQIFNLNLSRWITVIWASVWIFSLFLPWISIVDQNKSILNNSFNATSWNIWYIIILMLFSIIFLIFWWNYKEKMKLYSEIDIKNYLVILFSGLFIILSWIVCINFSIWLETFGWKEVKHWSWVILAITSAIFLMVWWYLVRKDFYKNSSEIILEKLNRERNKEKAKENISLPF